ncbi:hypothetical protein SAE02_61790 [Skermanella aerolata]|uniref:Uncharacterized protein n=1 Tax=Skermanella aerolata TaxID=393310 RepID=A0A512DZX7_9PROT|nr:hypothetical protein [Skermanella aerolata]KJB91862.1 hypothetical protein N826_25435 [Skermanella aerolata KACC 11604]GEO42031.1 hypothetical protein SAE02_61790 [Skermanella aerolata]
MFDYTIYADHPAVRALRLSFAFLVTLWTVVMYMPGWDWIPTFAGLIVMCNPVAWSEIIVDRSEPTVLRLWRRWTDFRATQGVALRPLLGRMPRLTAPGFSRFFRG